MYEQNYVFVRAGNNPKQNVVWLVKRPTGSRYRIKMCEKEWSTSRAE